MSSSTRTLPLLAVAYKAPGPSQYHVDNGYFPDLGGRTWQAPNPRGHDSQKWFGAPVVIRVRLAKDKVGYGAVAVVCRGFALRGCTKKVFVGRSGFFNDWLLRKVGSGVAFQERSAVGGVGTFFKKIL